MAGNSTEECDVGGSSLPTEGISASQRCKSIDSLAEWRSSEQVENGTPSTSPPFWDTDDDDECGPKPSELYGKFTWKVEDFRQINKRELRSNAFEVGGYKWYILIYPQGCDVCNHLSLFLCVANHDKLLPGWSHFAQFTIAVVNKDPKKSKFSDTLHRFWKKEHDWGWKKFMENSKVYESFVNDNTLVIKAQVQVIREKANRPFRCLDCQYRRELIRVYLSNVEQICRRFIEDKKTNLSKLIEDKVRWSSFCSFWTGIDQITRRRMSRDKSDTILRVVVKQFFVEKEVTSTLVMDSLHSGLKALEHQSKDMKGRLKAEMVKSSDPIVRVDKDMFVLSDDVVPLLDKVVSEPLPTTSLPPKDDNASLNRAKEGNCCEEFNKESLERDERRLTELGQRTVEICAVAHIFSRIEVAYQEAVALKRQEELIREEEAAWQAEHELKAKRAAVEKEKKAKKKQAKQKRNNRRSKNQERDLTSDQALNESQRENLVDEIVSTKFSSKLEQFTSEKLDLPKDASDLTFSGEEVAESFHPHLDAKYSSNVNWDTDASEVHPCMETGATYNSNEQLEKTNPVIDDSSSTCSTDSVPSVVSNGPYKGFSGINSRSQTSPNRGKNQLSKDLLSQESIAGHFCDFGSGSSCRDMEAGAAPLRHSARWPEKHMIDKHEEPATVQKKVPAKDQGDTKRSLASFSALKVSSTLACSGRKTPLVHLPKNSLESSTTSSSTMTASALDPIPSKPTPASNPTLTGRSAARSLKLPQSSTTKSESQSSATPNISKNTAARSLKLPQSSTTKSECQSSAAPNISKNTTAQPSSAISKPSSAPLFPATSGPTRPIVSNAQKLQLSRSVSAAGRLGIDPSPSVPTCAPQSYRNAIIGKTATGFSIDGLSHTSSSQSTTFASTSILPPQSSARKEHQMDFRPTFTFGSVKPDELSNHHERREDSLHQAGTSSNLANGIERLEICTDQLRSSQSNGGVVDDFPHLDIINDLLDEEQSIMGSAASSSHKYYPQHHLHPLFSLRYSFLDDMASSSDLGLFSNALGRYDHAEQFYDDVFHCVYPQMDLSASYAIGQMDGLVQVDWPPFGHSDVSGAAGYSYQHSNYTNLGRGVNGYGMYRP